MTTIEWTTVLIYASFAIDLIGIPVPSIASTQQLFFPHADTSLKNEKKNLLRKVRNWPTSLKTALLFLPTSIGVLTYLLPLIVIMFPFTENVFGHFPASNNKTIILTGVSIAIMGRLLAIGAALNIRKNNSQKNDDFSLKTKNIFRFSRNPILLGLHLTFIGLLIIYPVPTMLIGGVIYISNMHFRVILEESFLKEKFGISFIEYCKKTKRYF